MGPHPFGAHRLEARKQLNWREILANTIELGKLDTVIAECDENLCDSNLSPAEVALFTAKRIEAYEALPVRTV